MSSFEDLSFFKISLAKEIVSSVDVFLISSTVTFQKVDDEEKVKFNLKYPSFLSKFSQFLIYCFL